MRAEFQLTAALLFSGILALAQGDDKRAVEGSVTLGYRFTDVSGYKPKFDELYGLGSGLRLMDVSLFAKRALSWADEYSLALSGIGGDPYSTAQLTARKRNVYDLRLNYRQTRYYFNRNDRSTLPNGLNGLTSFHDWATVRKFGSGGVLLHLTKNLRMTFEFSRNSRDGVNFTTRSLEYFGAPSAWGSFARANPFYLTAPVEEIAYRGTAGLDYTLGSWSLHYRTGYQSFDDAVRGVNSTSPQRSINVDDAATARELATRISWSDSRQLKTPVSEFSYTGRLARKLEARGGYLFYRYSGPATLSLAFEGIARSNAAGTTVAPYSIAESSHAHATEPNHVVDQGFSYRPKDWWTILVDYRYTRFTVESAAEFRSESSGVVAQGEAESEWRLGTHTVDANMAFAPVPSLLIRTGARFLKSDIEALEDGTIDVQRTRRVKTVWPTASLYYQPSKVLTIRGTIDQINNGSPYTRVTPHIDKGGRVFVKFRPLEKFSVDSAVVIRERKLVATDYRSTIRSTATTATYAIGERFSLFTGFSYDTFFASNFVNFLRGPAPIAGVVLRDQTVDRVWQAGVNASPLPRLGFSFAGNYLRTTGIGEITGEAPLYGPIRFPYASGTIHYDFPRAGRLIVLLQRTYYSEQIVSGNNVGAHILTISWTKSF